MGRRGPRRCVKQDAYPLPSLILGQEARRSECESSILEPLPTCTVLYPPKCLLCPLCLQYGAGGSEIEDVCPVVYGNGN
jgi:hypothetical protein